MLGDSWESARATVIASNLLATFAEFVVELLRMRTREGMAIARANGKLKGKSPKLGARQRAHSLKLYEAGEHQIAEIAELFSVSRATVYREIARAGMRVATSDSSHSAQTQTRLDSETGRDVRSGPFD